MIAAPFLSLADWTDIAHNSLPGFLSPFRSQGGPTFGRNEIINHSLPLSHPRKRANSRPPPPGFYILMEKLISKRRWLLYLARSFFLLAMLLRAGRKFFNFRESRHRVLADARIKRIVVDGELDRHAVFHDIISRYLITPRGMTRFFLPFSFFLSARASDQSQVERVCYIERNVERGRERERRGQSFHKSVPRKGSRSLPAKSTPCFFSPLCLVLLFSPPVGKLLFEREHQPRAIPLSSSLSVSPLNHPPPSPLRIPTPSLTSDVLIYA